MNKEVTILMKLTDRASAGFRNVSKSFGDAVKGMQNSVAGAKNAISDYVKGMQEGSEKARAFADGLKTIAVGAGIVAGAVILVAKSSISAAIEMESLKLGLTSVAGSAEAAEMQMKDLQEVAKLPGLGLQEAIQGSTRLQAVGINAQLANKALMEFGNALARVGKGREELSGVILALTQIVGKGKVTAEEINQIAERVPEVRKVMKEAFGTAATEEIQKMNISAESFIETLVEGFSKLPRVVGGTRNEIENFNDAVFQARAAVGKALLPTFTELLGILTKAVNWFNQLSTTDKQMITWAGAIAGGVAALVSAFGGLLLLIPQIIAGAQALGITLAGLSAASGPIGLAILALGALTAGIFALRAEINKTQQPIDEFGGTIAALASMAQDSDKAISALGKSEISKMTAEFSAELEQARLQIEKLKKLRETAPVRPMGAPPVPYLHRTIIDEQISELEKKAGELTQKLKRLGEIPTDAKSPFTPFIEDATKLADDIRKTEAQTAEIRSGLIKDEQQRELELLRVRHEANIKEIDARISELKGATADELHLAQALNDQKVALEKQYHQERIQIIDEEADKSQKRLNEWVKDRVQAGVLATNAELKEIERRRIAEQNALDEMLLPYLALEERTKSSKERIAQAAMQEIDDEIQAQKELNKIRIGPTETYVKILEAQRRELEKMNDTYQELSEHTSEFDQTVRDVMTGWRQLTAENIDATEEWGQAYKDLADDIKREFADIRNAIVYELKNAFQQWVNDGKEAMSELEFATQGFIQALEGDYAGLMRTVGTYFSQLWDIWRGIDTNVKNAIKEWQKELPSSIADTIGRGVLEGLSAADIGKQVEEFLYKEVVMRSISVLLLGWDDFQDAIKQWATALENAVKDTSESGSEISLAEEEIIRRATEGISAKVKSVAKYGAELANSLGVVQKDVEKAGSELTNKTTMPDWMDFTKVGIFPEERGMTSVNLSDILMKPQREFWNLPESATEGLMGGHAPSISDVVETKPGVTFVQNNQFNGLVNFDNPEAMRELARKLQPYTEELQERWVN